VECTKAHFTRHGIADVISDNGPQFANEEYSRFQAEWGFNHTTSSPLYSQSNNKWESVVKIHKNILKKPKSQYPQLALLEWRNIPDIYGNSPVQKLFSRRTKALMSNSVDLWKPQVIDEGKETIKLKRQKAKSQFNKSVRPLPELV